MKNRYNTEEYRTLITEFCDYKNYTKAQRSKSLLKDCVLEKDLLNDNEDEQDLIQVLSNLIVKELCANSMNYSYLLEQRSYLVAFYEWCIQIKKIFSWQPFDSIFLSPKILLHEMSHYVELAVFDDAMIEELCNKFVYNRPIYELLIRSFYEGIPSVTKFLSIKCSHINFETNRIAIDGEEREFSERYMQVVRAYLDTTTFDVTLNDQIRYTKKMISFNDYLFKKVCKVDGESVKEENFIQNSKKTITEYFNTISKIFSSKVNAIILYKSGFINYVYHRCNKDKNLLLDLFVHVVEERSNKFIGRKLEEYAKDYGIHKSNKYIRNEYSLYVMKSKFYPQG